VPCFYGVVGAWQTLLYALVHAPNVNGKHCRPSVPSAGPPNVGVFKVVGHWHQVFGKSLHQFLKGIWMRMLCQISFSCTHWMPHL
jgi:hypothetical protein